MRYLLLVALLAGCSSPASDTEEPTEPPTFDVTAVRASFTDECVSPIVVDDLFCEQVDIDGMSADGTILMVPTTLAAEARDRARVICETIARAHFDGDGNELGYRTVGVLYQSGENAAACTVR